MTTSSTTLLGLALPVTGELSNTWGDVVNNSITNLVDSAISGTTTLSSDADVTLTTTTLAANQARQAIILWTAGGTVTRTITAPAQSKPYIVINKTSSSQSIKIVGVGPTTGVTIVAGTAALVAWNGVDFVTVSVTATTGILPVANGGTGLASGTSGGVLAYTATGTLASSGLLAASALVLGGGAGAAPATTTTGTGVVTALGVNTGTAGAFVVNGGALGSPSSAGTIPAFTLGGTVAGGGNQLNNVIIGTTTPLAGAFTTVSASGQVRVTGAVSTNATGLTFGYSGSSVSLIGAWGANSVTRGILSFYLSDSAGGIGNEYMRLTDTGLAVTGTLSATGDLTLSGTVGRVVSDANSKRVLIAGGSTATTTTGAYAIFEGYDYGGAGAGGAISLVSAAGATNPITMSVGGTTRGVFSSTGLAVTGTLSATGNVSFQKAGVNTLLVENTADAQNVYFKLKQTTGTTTLGLNATATYFDDTASRAYVWYTNGTERARVDTTGLAVTGTLSATGQVTATSGLTIPSYAIDPGTAPAAINIALAGVGEGTATAQYGLKVSGLSYNNTTAVYGVYSNMTQQLTASIYGGYFESTGIYNNHYGVYAKNTHNPNATSTGYGIYISENTNYTTTSGATTALHVAQNATSGGTATGIYVNTVAGATTVTPLQIQHAGADVFKVSTTGAAVTGTLSVTGDTTFSSGGATFGNNTTVADVYAYHRHNNAYAWDNYYKGGVQYASELHSYGGGTVSYSAAWTWLDYSSSTQVLAVQKNYVLALQGGATTTGTGIAFPATQSASTDANTLDDYEEGTWTPTDASGASLSFSTANCRYTKIGRMVSIQGTITYPVTASGASAQFGGFPFASADQITVSVIYSDASVANFTYLSGNTTNVFLLIPGVNVVNSTMSGKFFTFSGTYAV